MAVPSLDKTWDFTDINVQLPATAIYHSNGIARNDQILIWTIKEQLKSWGWTCEGSASPGSYGMDGVDRWVTPTSFVWGTTPYYYCCWIVLKLANCDGLGLGHDFYWMFWCASNNYPGYPRSGLGFGYTAWTPFTGGNDQHTRPTSTTEREWFSDAGWSGCIESGEVTPYRSVLHSFVTSDNAVQRLLVTHDHGVGCYLAFERVKNPTPGWDVPFVATWLPNTSPSYANMNDSACFTSWHNGGSMTLYASGESHVSALSAERVTYRNEISGEAHFYPVGVVSDTSSRRGRLGTLYDIWWAHSEMANGDSYPGDANTFVTFGKLILPWPSGTAIITR